MRNGSAFDIPESLMIHPYLASDGDGKKYARIYCSASGIDIDIKYNYKGKKRGDNVIKKNNQQNF